MTDDAELLAMNAIWSALKTLPDDESRVRCIEWALSRLKVAGHLAVDRQSPTGLARGVAPANVTPAKPVQDTLEDIVEQGESGALRVIARDLKAKSRNDAAVRLVYLVVYANEVLNRQQKTSSKKLVVPVLSEWRAYDGNTRTVIANDRGIKRDGDLLSLDVHSRRQAQEFVAQIRDASTKGNWSPLKSKQNRGSSKPADLSA